MTRDLERGPIRRTALIAALCGLGVASCIGPGLEPPDQETSDRSLGEPSVTPIPGAPGAKPPTFPGMNPTGVVGAAGASAAPDAAAPATETPAGEPQRPADAGVARDPDGGTDDSGVER